METGQEDVFRILLVDDDPGRWKRISEALPALHHARIVSIIENAEGLLGHLDRVAPDMVILNAEAKEMDGSELIHSIKMRVPRVKVVILATAGDREKLKGILSAGADGYLLHEDLERGIPDAVEAIRNGKIYVSPGSYLDLTDDWVRACRREWAGFPRSLTAREKEILKFIAEGESNKEIASQLSISMRTVEHHRTNIMSKLALKRTADLIRYAICTGTA